jgi:hypothetical protein
MTKTASLLRRLICPEPNALLIDLFRLILFSVITGEYLELVTLRNVAFRMQVPEITGVCLAIVALCGFGGLGIYPRLVSLACFILTSVVAGNNQLFYEVDKEIPFWLLASALAPVRPRAALLTYAYRSIRGIEAKAGFGHSTIPQSYILLLTSFLYINYFGSILVKFRSEYWLQGAALWYATLQPIMTSIKIPNIVHIEPLFVAANYVVIVYETLFPLVLIRPFRKAFVLLGLMLHIGIAVMLPLKYFGMIMTAPLICFIPKEWSARFLRNATMVSEISSWHEPKRLSYLRIGVVIAVFVSHPLISRLTDYGEAFRTTLRTLTGSHTTGVYGDAAFAHSAPVFQMWFLEERAHYRIASFSSEKYSEIHDRLWKSIGFFARAEKCGGDRVIDYLRHFEYLCSSGECVVVSSSRSQGYLGSREMLRTVSSMKSSTRQLIDIFDCHSATITWL